eukprot:TRINITY_DN20555_c0_g1_i1.p1 TRINITY_DN20555_c0_g1~~TRINITY_DN20555_c0_g1_i1.p1  ORF type:complete len:252 (-),score=49.17 TRINITY_DN20555_c0_g1_i1:233-988(-)
MADNVKSGTTLNGLVKSYNRKGFGFLMCQEIPTQDIYFSRESLHPHLQTSDLAGEQVKFELHKFADGKMQARNLRPLGDVTNFKANSYSNREYGAGARASMFGGGRGLSDEDRTRDWFCKSCGERNFMKRLECFKCRSARPFDDPSSAPPVEHVSAAPRRTASPHAGSRAMRETYKAELMASRGGAAPQVVVQERRRTRRRVPRKSGSGPRAVHQNQALRVQDPRKEIEQVLHLKIRSPAILKWRKQKLRL